MKKAIITFCAAGFFMIVACDNQATRNEDVNDDLNDQTDTTSYGSERGNEDLNNEGSSQFGAGGTEGDYDNKTGPTSGGVSEDEVDYTENDLPENIRQKFTGEEAGNVMIQSSRSYMRDGKKYYEVILEEKETPAN
ncbi:hypothetical protein [Marivirga lumbricoides]